MNNSHKILILSFIPALLTIIFAVYVTFPNISHLKSLHSKLESQKDEMAKTQTDLNNLKNNDKLLNELVDMRGKLYDFDVKIPSTDDLAILLVDFDKLAAQNKLKITTFRTKNSKTIDLNPEDPSKSRRKRSKKSEQPQLKLISIPVETVVVGYYPDVLKFVSNIENYQRKIAVKNVTIRDYQGDKAAATPRVEVTVNYFVYKTEKIQPEITQEKQ